jgi:hypothetical protein
LGGVAVGAAGCPDQRDEAVQRLPDIDFHQGSVEDERAIQVPRGNRPVLAATSCGGSVLAYMSVELGYPLD